MQVCAFNQRELVNSRHLCIALDTYRLHNWKVSIFINLSIYIFLRCIDAHTILYNLYAHASTLHIMLEVTQTISLQRIIRNRKWNAAKSCSYCCCEHDICIRYFRVQFTAIRRLFDIREIEVKPIVKALNINRRPRRNIKFTINRNATAQSFVQSMM